jgi:lipoprotein NlpI
MSTNSGGSGGEGTAAYSVPARWMSSSLAYADKGEYDRALPGFDVVMRFDAKNALTLYARGLTLLK